MDTSKKTIIVFSGDFDRVFAAFIIANGAAAMGDDSGYQPLFVPGPWPNPQAVAPTTNP